MILSNVSKPVKAYFADRFVFKSLVRAASENLLCLEDKLIACNTDKPLKQKHKSIMDTPGQNINEHKLRKIKNRNEDEIF